MANDTLHEEMPVDQEEPKECFVIMPFSDHVDYDKGHFERVYKDIFVPAIITAGFIPFRADDDKGTNLIHVEMLKKIINCPMALCDLSTRNPNVLFELGIRQSFDMPVLLVQELNTPKIFDIAGLRYTEYRKARIYNEVLEDQAKIADAIKQTYDNSMQGNAINSLIRLISIRPARLTDPKETDPNIEIILNELADIKQEMHTIRRRSNKEIRPSFNSDYINQTINDKDIIYDNCITILNSAKQGGPINSQLLNQAMKIIDGQWEMTNDNKYLKLANEFQEYRNHIIHECNNATSSII